MPQLHSIPLLMTALVLLAFTPATKAQELPAPTSLTVHPTEFILRGADNRQRLVVSCTESDSDGIRHDYSRKVSYASSDPNVATVTSDGVVVPRGNGKVEIKMALGNRTVVARGTVSGHGEERQVSFRNQVVPIFTRLGCNAGGCHGKALGQNNFKLSLLGFDTDFDYAAVVKEARGRRIFPASADNSLLLLKATGGVAHGGGGRLKRDSLEYELLRRWIMQGTPPGSSSDPRVTRIECLPRARVVGRHAEQQMQVTAFYSDGSSRDVTHEAQFKSNDTELANVDESGLIRTDKGTGDTAVMARYMGQVDVTLISIPLTGAVVADPMLDLPKKNYIDELVQAKWRQLKLAPSSLADDATFLRRAYIDCIGTLPTPAEVRAFLNDKSPNKREECIDRLLARNEYADFWAVKWGDLLRNQRKNSKENQRGTFAFHAWIRNAFATNMPYDRFVRNIIAAQGTVDQHPPVIWYRTVRNLTHQTNDTAQLFLGTRISCAQCHHHPYEKWSQDDYYQMQAFFGRMGRKAGEIAQEPAIFVKLTGDVRNQATGKVMQPRGLDGPPIKISEDEDPRQKLVDWMAASDNPFFARAIVNRMWAHYMGRGLVEPVDDMRVTNPASNPELLDALAKDFIAHKFDLKHLIRTIMASTAYQLSSDPQPGNIHDKQSYARAYPRRLTAEVMLDAICQVTGMQENYAGLPKNMRAIQLPDESVSSYFLDVFNRPRRETACECERPREANLAQSLLLLNSGEMQGKVGAGTGRLALLLKSNKADAELLDELYLWALARPPRADERAAVLAYVAEQGNRQVAFEDVLWALLNTKEFLFNH
jgi:hypothetical protein